jgi:hypothetical protein
MISSLLRIGSRGELLFKASLKGACTLSLEVPRP